jgi:hypothetical protein
MMHLEAIPMIKQFLISALLAPLGSGAFSSAYCFLENPRMADGPQTYVITVTFGKSSPYSSPTSNEPLHWDGTLRIEGGTLVWIDKLLYAPTEWEKGWSGCSREYRHRLQKPDWKSEIVPGSGNGTEGIRFSLQGTPASQVTIATQSKTISFRLDELLEKEMLEYHCGAHYSGQPIIVFLGQDGRIRVSRKQHDASLAREQRAGAILMPDDFAGDKTHFMSTYCAIVPASGISRASFDIINYPRLPADTCILHAQLMAAQDRQGELDVVDKWITVGFSVGTYRQDIRYFFSKFRMVQKMIDLYVPIPSDLLREKDNTVQIHNFDSSSLLLVHRLFVNENPVSHKANLQRLPALPEKANFWIGYDENTLTPQNGEVDKVLRMMAEDEIGNYMLLRLQEVHNVATAEDFTRWGTMLSRYNMRAGLDMPRGSIGDPILRQVLGKNFLGVHQHEMSNLIYGWGEADPLEKRGRRTLPECEEYYTRRIGQIEIFGQALPMTHLDYRTGVGYVFSEPPTGHTTLMFASQRGSVYAYDRNLWGVHNANHIPRMPADDATARRNFILMWQAWLYGARLLYDEESALYALHDAPRAFSDPYTFNRRTQMQTLYHYASAIDLGKEEVGVGFLQGRYDCLVGGLQSGPDVPRTKVWGMIGPETSAWEFNTPERGWELLSTFMPGVWLYPVLQDPTRIRQFFGGSPHGQVDLVPAEESAQKLAKYRLLVLPGWNTMTGELYQRLIQYVRGGGHLVLSAAQCTRHITRDFLNQKKEFLLLNDGDLSLLAGVRVKGVTGTISKIRWRNGPSCDAPGLPGLATELTTGQALATDEQGNPVLVENKLGKGKVWLLTVGEYWGAPALDAFRALLGDRLAASSEATTRLTGDTRDVDYHVYDCPDGWRRIALLNTDWTTAGNLKQVTLHTSALHTPVNVVEGSLVQVLEKDGLALVFATPGTICSPEKSSGRDVKIKAAGVGKETIRLLSSKAGVQAYLDGRELLSSDGSVTIDFGPRWKEVSLDLKVGNTR